jgi:hypothetical protein
MLLVGIKSEIHDLRQNLALVLLLDAVDELVEDPRAWNKLRVLVSLIPCTSICERNIVSEVNVPLD